MVGAFSRSAGENNRRRHSGAPRRGEPEIHHHRQRL